MGIRRSDHVVVRPDGTLERVASVEPSSEEQAENERLGDRFDELLQQDEPGAPAEERDARSSLLLTPARPPWRDPAAKAATPPEPATVGRERDAERPKESSRSDRADDAPADPSADAPDASGARAALHAKHGKSGEREGGHDSGGGQGDKDGAMMALQGDPARPQPAPGAPAGASAPPSSGAGLIAEVAGEVASRIATTSGHGASQVRIDLRDEVLPQTSMTVENQAGMVVVTLSSGSNETAEILSSHAAELGRAISRRTGKRTRIVLAGQSWTTDPDGEEAGDAPDGAPDRE